VSSTLRDPAHRVSPRTPLVWAAGALVPVTFLAAGLVVATSVWHWWDMPVAGWVAYGVVASAYVVTMPAIRYRVHRWETTDNAVYTQTGWLSRERRIAPMSRVQTVDVEQGPVARLLGLASVTVTTASAAGPLRIDGLDRTTADRLVTDLTRQTAAQPGDAT
jgi:membrane protein YdbS with pleckstrin-like domain